MSTHCLFAYSLLFQVPEFCHLVQGAADSNGLLHGEGEAMLAWRTLKLSGQWSHGLPCGPVKLSSSITDSDVALELVTELPSASDYAEAPARIAPGYLWPCPSPAHCGKRVVTLAALGGSRTYEVGVCGSGIPFAISLRCVDQEPGRVGSMLLLPPRISGVIFEDGYARGDTACILLHSAANASDCTVYYGKVAGRVAAPFQRQGQGRLYIPHRGSKACLAGFWVGDIFQTSKTAVSFPLRSLSDQPQVLVTNASECRTCLGVFSIQHRNHRCRPATISPPANSPARAARRPPIPPGKLTSTFHLLGFDGSCVAALVRQHLDYSTGKHLGGACGAYAYVQLVVSGSGESRCYAKGCRETLASRRSARCPHLDAVRSFVGANTCNITLAPALSLDGFMLLLGLDVAHLPARTCLVPCCVGECTCVADREAVRLQRDEKCRACQIDAQAVVAVQQLSKGLQSVSMHKGDDGSSSSGDDSVGSSVETWPVDTLHGYTPAVSDILHMRERALATLCQFHDLPSSLSSTMMKHQLVEYFHPGEVGHLAGHYNLAGMADHRKSGRKAKGKGKGKGKVPSNAFATFHRTQRCVHGSLCREFAAQKAKAEARLQELEQELELECPACEPEAEEAEAEEAECPPIPTAAPKHCPNPRCRAFPCELDASNERCLVCGTRVCRARLHRSSGGYKEYSTPTTGCGEASAEQSAPQAVGQRLDLPVLALTSDMVDDFLYSIVLSRFRSTAPVVSIADDYYAVLRSDYSEGGYRSPGGYSLVHMHLLQERCSSSDKDAGDPLPEGAARLRFHCSCSEFAACRTGMGGRSRSSAARICTCCLMVVAAKALSTTNSELRLSCNLWLLAARVAVGEGDASSSSEPSHCRGGSDKAAEAALKVDVLCDGPKFPEVWPTEQHLLWKRQTLQLELAAHEGGAAQVLSRPMHSVFPPVVRPLPVAAPCCPFCKDAGGSPLPLQCQRSRSNVLVWVFIGNLILNEPIETYVCTAPGHAEIAAAALVSGGVLSSTCHGGLAHQIHSQGVPWTTSTGLFSNGECWYFSVLLLDEVSRWVWGSSVPPNTACETILSASFDFMGRLGTDPSSLPNSVVAREKMYDAWFSYELVHKGVDYAAFCKCMKCGWLPAKTGSDACAKVAINLAHDAAWAQLDYSPQAEGTPLWTQDRLMQECHRWSAAKCLPGWQSARTHSACIPVDLVPPIFFSSNYAADTLCNTEALKRAPSALASRKELDKKALLPVAQLVYDGDPPFDVVALRSGSADQSSALDDLLRRCGAPAREHTRPNSKKREWLLKAWDTLAAGDSHCHMFVSVKKGTGGTVSLSCPHGVVIAYKFLFAQESNRDHDDLLRSLILEPAVHWMDDSCGLVTFRQGLRPNEFRQLYGENRGCPRKWCSDPSPSCLTPMDIPEIAEDQIRRDSVYNPSLIAHAHNIRHARGAKRTSRHPFLFKHRWRLCLTDRLHQSVKKKTHKRDSCQQHIASIVRTLCDDRSNIMESLNARMHRRLSTICTLSPKRAIPFYHRMVYWENRRIIERQVAEFRRATLPGQKVVEPEPFGIALYVCEKCTQPITAEDGRCPCSEPARMADGPTVQPAGEQAVSVAHDPAHVADGPTVQRAGEQAVPVARNPVECCGACTKPVPWDCTRYANDPRHRCSSCACVVHSLPSVCLDAGALMTSLAVNDGKWYCSEECYACIA